MTQDQLAARSGVRQPNIVAYEKGNRTPSPDMLSRLLDAAKARPSVVLAQHRAEILRLARRNHALDVRVFGSIARGEDGPDSDIDLLVTFDAAADVFDHAGLIEDLRDLLGRDVDVVSERALLDRDHAIRDESVPL